MPNQVPNRVLAVSIITLVPSQDQIPVEIDHPRFQDGRVEIGKKTFKIRVKIPISGRGRDLRRLLQVEVEVRRRTEPVSRLKAGFEKPR